MLLLGREKLLAQLLRARALALLGAGRLAALPGNLAAYRRDGRVLKLPVEKRPPREPHAEPHWFPVLLRPMERVREEEAEAGG